jgi:O-antigen ligase
MTRSIPAASDKQQHWLTLSLLVCIFLVLFVGNGIFSKPVLAAVLLVYLPFMMWDLSANLSASILLLTKPKSMVALWTLFILSFFWSVLPAVSLNLILVISAFMVLAIFISIHHQAEGFSKPLRFAVMLLLTGAAIYAAAFPSSLSGDAVLFYKQKNNLGVLMGLSVLVLIYTHGRNLWHVGFTLLATLFLLASHSKTAIAIVGICIVLLPLANWWIKKFYTGTTRSSFRIWLYRLSLLSLTTLVLFRNQFLDLLWTHFTKDMLTGRGTLWLVIIQHIRGNSLLGIGPGTFWKIEDNGGSEISRTAIFMMDPTWVQHLGAGDGSYIDLIASIGVLGLALFLYTAIDLYRGLIRNWDRPDSKLMFVITTYVLMHAVTETTILSSCNVLWLAYVLCYFRVAGYEHTRTLAKR